MDDNVNRPTPCQGNDSKMVGENSRAKSAMVAGPSCGSDNPGRHSENLQTPICPSDLLEENPDFRLLYILVRCAASYSMEATSGSSLLQKAEFETQSEPGSSTLSFKTVPRAKRSELQRPRSQSWGKTLLSDAWKHRHEMTMTNRQEDPDEELKLQGVCISPGAILPVNMMPAPNTVAQAVPPLNVMPVGHAIVQAASPLNAMPVANAVIHGPKFKGINFYRRIGRWTTHIWTERKQFYAGAYSFASDAARAYDKACIKHFGAETELNFEMNDYLQDINEMAGLSLENYRSLLQRRAIESNRHLKVTEGITVCPKGLFEVRMRDPEPPRKWHMLGIFNNLEDAERCYTAGLA